MDLEVDNGSFDRFPLLVSDILLFNKRHKTRTTCSSDEVAGWLLNSLRYGAQRTETEAPARSTSYCAATIEGSFSAYRFVRGG